MQQGIFLLWLLSVLASAGCWLYLEVTFFVFGRRKIRRRLTGCELAREFLDLSGLRQVTVASLPVRGRAHLTGDGEALGLGEDVFYATRPGALSLALHEAGHFLARAHSPAPLSLRQAAGRSLRIPLIVSWFFVAAGTFFPPLRGVTVLGHLIFLSIFFLALATLSEEAEVTERALAGLGRLEGFELEERLGLRRLVRAIFVLPLAEVFAGPLEMPKMVMPEVVTVTKKGDSHHFHFNHFTGV